MQSVQKLALNFANQGRAVVNIPEEVEKTVKDARIEYALTSLNAPDKAEEHHDYMLTKWFTNLVDQAYTAGRRDVIESINALLQTSVVGIDQHKFTHTAIQNYVEAELEKENNHE